MEISFCLINPASADLTIYVEETIIIYTTFIIHQEAVYDGTVLGICLNLLYVQDQDFMVQDEGNIIISGTRRYRAGGRQYRAMQQR